MSYYVSIPTSSLLLLRSNDTTCVYEYPTIHSTYPRGGVHSFLRWRPMEGQERSSVLCYLVGQLYNYVLYLFLMISCVVGGG